MDENGICEQTYRWQRAIRTFCIGKKNWMFHDSVRDARASAVIYSLSETAKLDDLLP